MALVRAHTASPQISFSLLLLAFSAMLKLKKLLMDKFEEPTIPPPKSQRKKNSTHEFHYYRSSSEMDLQFDIFKTQWRGDFVKQRC